ncbi:lysylphosphatidylglycerol synthase transmembrane domain-containing protein [Sphingobium sp.]|uniref:lysylphosphatidylglycerol synthase transmembrane domain-containing protein n=1 Tax=Sphingobium sp. TaxID=1912891 RepID=UPI002C3CC10B|nr:lysylphosphatidylglycerol synthase transmembrane domain-containing protein [Sphingobium sp.]HUD92136.1 lysylphosphatidylglycerol synthase transmembrane domain-containing protein [Sphingobium sp.]
MSAPGSSRLSFRRLLPPIGLSSRYRRALLQSLVGVALLGIFISQLDLAEIAALTRQATIAPLVVALLLYALDFYLRAVRFWMLLEAVSDRSVPLRAVPGPFITSFGISDLLPLRAGDIFRLAWFQRNMGLPISSVLGAMLIERFYDLSALLLLGGFLVAAHVGAEAGLIVALGLPLGFMILTRLAGMMAGHAPVPSATSPDRGLRGRLVDGVWATLRSFTILRSSRRQGLFLGLSLLCWLLEAGLFLGAWISLGGRMEQWAAAMAAFTASTLGTLVPGLPGHFGTFELFGLAMFRLGGVDRNFGAAVLMLAHMMLWAPTALYAMVWLALTRRGGRSRQETE